jgi:hypothetical protein
MDVNHLIKQLSLKQNSSKSTQKQSNIMLAGSQDHRTKQQQVKTYLNTQYSSITQSNNQGPSNVSSLPTSIGGGGGNNKSNNSRALLAESKRYSSIKHSGRDTSTKKPRSKDSRATRVSTAGKCKMQMPFSSNLNNNSNIVNGLGSF